MKKTLKHTNTVHNKIKHMESTLNFIESRIGKYQPQWGIILGTGLGRLVNEIEIDHTLEYKDIPDFPVSTVESHKGRLKNKK